MPDQPTPKLRDSLIMVKPQTVISWYGAGFRLFWRFSIPNLESLLTLSFCRPWGLAAPEIFDFAGDAAS